MAATVNNVILNGFDRCGSSAIARTLARHPGVELIFQPFNSGNIRRILYEIMSAENARPEDYQFFSMLQQGRLETSYIKSQWHEKHSTTLEFKPGQLHVVKTTLNHFTVTWVAENFPLLEQWGIWRDPLDILASITRNNFFDRWYTDALDQIVPSVRGAQSLSEPFEKFIHRLDNPIAVTAFLISVRSFYFFSHISADKVIVYEEFVADANRALKSFATYFGLPPFDFQHGAKNDLNVMGKKFDPESTHHDVLSATDIQFVEEVFRPLRDVVADRFGIVSNA